MVVRPLRSLILTAALAAVLLPSTCPAVRASVPATEPATGWAAAAGVRSGPDVTLVSERPAGSAPRGAGSRRARAVSPRLPAGRWALSATLRAAPRSGLRVVASDGTTIARLRARADGRLAVSTGATSLPATPRPAAPEPWTHRIELVGGGGAPRLAVDGRLIPVGVMGRVRFVGDGAGPVRITALTVTPAARRDALLLHRLADLHARTPPGRFPLGEGADGRLRFSGGWTSGFWPGALWGAGRLVPRGPYAGWALDASLARRGAADTPIHDVGFMVGRSVVAAFERLCATPAQRASARCRALRASGLAAAETLVRLAGTARTGMIPTDASGSEAQTIVDSLMNIGLLTWATRVSGEPRYAGLARTHATLVMDLLQRADGSTIQVADHERASGRLLRLGTRQGLSDTSTWARGQAWAIYGLADVGRALGDRALVAGAERAAAFWMRAAPARGLPPYDLAAGAAAPRDSSAAAIAAAGIYELAGACRSVAGACASPARWAGVAGVTLEAALGAVSTTPPLGRLGEQAYTVGARNGAWDDRAELIWGLDFALEAIAERHLAAR